MVNSWNNADKHAMFCPRTWAKIIAKQTWRRSVDFPPIFGPVKSMNGAWFSPPRLISFGTKHWPPSRLLSRIGCLNPFAISNGADLSEWQQIIGLQVVPIIQLLAIERLMRASSSAKTQHNGATSFSIRLQRNTSSGKMLGILKYPSFLLLPQTPWSFPYFPKLPWPTSEQVSIGTTRAIIWSVHPLFLCSEGWGRAWGNSENQGVFQNFPSKDNGQKDTCYYTDNK